jgi:hypothetical protein
MFDAYRQTLVRTCCGRPADGRADALPWASKDLRRGLDHSLRLSASLSDESKSKTVHKAAGVWCAPSRDCCPLGTAPLAATALGCARVVPAARSMATTRPILERAAGKQDRRIEPCPPACVPCSCSCRGGLRAAASIFGHTGLGARCHRIRRLRPPRRRPLNQEPGLLAESSASWRSQTVRRANVSGSV